MMEKKVKCQQCLGNDIKSLMKKDTSNNKYYHTEKCYEEYLDSRNKMKIEKEKLNCLLDLVVDIYKLDKRFLIPRTFHIEISIFRKEFNHHSCLSGLIKGYEYCREKIEYARKNKQSDSLINELKYGLSIVRSYMYDVMNNYNLKKESSKNKEFELSADQKKELESYKIESPIEEKLLISLLYENHEKNLVKLRTQKEFEINKRNYRVDFIVNYNDKEYIVECDGHDSHERTKEQAARDKQRDRDFLSLGIPTIRFSGSEIWNDPKGCVQEIMSIVKINF